MEPHRLMDELLSVARKLGLQVHIEPFVTPGVLAGGLCWVRGRHLILIDENASPVEQTGAMAEALSTFCLEGVYMAPEARRAVEAARQRSQVCPGPSVERDTRSDNIDDHSQPEPGFGSAGPRREQDNEK